MDGIVTVIAAIIIIGYVTFAIWFVCTRKTIGGSIGAAVACMTGGLFIVSFAAVAAMVIVIIAILAFIGAALGS